MDSPTFDVLYFVGLLGCKTLRMKLLVILFFTNSSACMIAFGFSAALGSGALVASLTLSLGAAIGLAFVLSASIQRVSHNLLEAVDDARGRDTGIGDPYSAGDRRGKIAEKLGPSIAETAAIAERKKLEALEAEIMWFKDMFDDAPVGYQELDCEGRLTRVNRTELEMLGYTAEEMIGRHTSEFVVEKASREAVAALLAGTAPRVSYERNFIRKDGSRLPVLIDSRRIRDAEGKTLGLRTTLQDISALKRVEVALTQIGRASCRDRVYVLV